MLPPHRRCPPRPSPAPVPTRRAARRGWGRATLLLGALLLGAQTPGGAAALDFEVAARTAAQAFEYLRVDRGVEARQRITQYLSLNGHDLLDDGKHRLRVRSLMRFDTDVALADEADDGPFGLERRYNQFHILYLYVEGQDLWGRLGFRAGRQLQSDVLGWYDFDGVATSVRLWRGLGVEAYGGLEVKQDVLAINDAAFDPDGTNPDGSRFELFDRPVYVLGGALSYVDQTNAQARVHYRRAFWHIGHGVERERLGAAASGRLFERLKLNAGAVYNFYIARIDQAEAGVTWRFAEPDLTVGVEYFRFVPWFDADSIFNVFSTQAFDDARLSVGWQINDDLYAMLRGGVRFYGQGEGYEVGLGAEQTVTGRGVVRWRPGLGVWTSLTHQSEVGLGGRRHHTSLAAQTPYYHDLWRVSGRVLHVNFDATYTSALEGDAFGANLGAGVRLGRYGQLELLVEQAINPYVDSELRALAVLDLGFSTTR